MSDKQKEACTAFSTGMRHAAIAAVFDKLPQRFKLTDLFKLAGLKDGPQARAAASAVLYRNFRCVNVGPCRDRCWKKP